MAERRMFALKITDSDAFLDMPKSSQALYFHLAMRADDDGFISSPKKIMRMIGASDDDMKILLAKRFLLSFDTGIVVIKHWRLHNYIAKDRYTETIYKEEKEKLFIKANGAYTDHPEDVAIPYTPCIQDDDTVKLSIVKVREGKDSKEKGKREKKEFTPPTLEEVQEYVKDKQLVINPTSFYTYYSSLEWKDNQGNQVKNWKGKAVTWNTRDIEKGNTKPFYAEKKPVPTSKPCQCGGIIVNGVCKSCGTLYDAMGNLL